jgi:hypothetical protein
LDQAGAERIPFDVPEHRQEMGILRNGKRLETALPDMTATVVAFATAADVGRDEPVHPITDWEGLKTVLMKQGKTAAARLLGDQLDSPQPEPIAVG